MLKITKIVGNSDAKGRRNETYKISKLPKVSKPKAVKEVEQGKHPDAHVVTAYSRVDLPRFLTGVATESRKVLPAFQCLPLNSHM